MISGIALAIFGFAALGIYSPGMSEEEVLKGDLIAVLILLLGIVAVTWGWLELKKNKKKRKGV